MKHFSIAELSASTTAKARGIDNTPQRCDPRVNHTNRKSTRLSTRRVWSTQNIERLREVHDTTTIVERVEVERIVRHISPFF